MMWFGVLMMICVLCLRFCVCGCIGVLLYSVSIFMFFLVCVRWCIFCVIWLVSLCVGYRIIVCMLKWCVLRCVSSVSENVVVLLLFVFVCVIRFWLVSVIGRFVVWIGVMLI